MWKITPEVKKVLRTKSGRIFQVAVAAREVLPCGQRPRTVHPMISPDLLAILRCPLTLQPLRIAPPELLARMAGGLEAALIREDGTMAYPVRGGIPVLLPEEAIPLDVRAG
jgi:uncharacterized protein YbaR (Trm112 family)